MELRLIDHVQYIKGIGPKRAAALQDVGVQTVQDLLNYFPRRYLDRTNICRIRDLRYDEAATVVGRVENFGLVKNWRTHGSRFRLVLSDDTGSLSLVWFQGARYYEHAFEAGELLAVYGRADLYNRELQIAHPEFDRLVEGEDMEFLHTGGIIPVYPGNEFLRRMGFDSRGFRKVIKPALDAAEQMKETLPSGLLDSHRLISLPAAYRQIHFPLSPDSLEKARRRLKFEELFYLQLMVAFRKKKISLQQKGVSYEKVGDRTRELLGRLPFELTESQKKVLKEIRADMKSPHPMNRLLQGDVGSGKTVVALLAMLIAVENEYQAAFMAPTEILAEQHYYNLQNYLWGMSVNVSLIKGGQKKREREAALEAIRNRQVDIVVGTHAVFQEQVEFARLGLIVIDEQHRFGVVQRAELRQKALHKGIYPDVLVMTATPIPRTLAMTLYGDLDVSVIDELPQGRRAVRTAIRRDDARLKLYEFCREEIARGRQCYFVYPLIDESEKTDLKAATEGYEELASDVFSDLRVGLLHGRMKGSEKQAVMTGFKNGELHVLVSTTVVEVGVDVPNATIMIVEHAERFGLTQLHQLRGRVGRGAEQSYCILMMGKDFVGDTSYNRLKIMEETTDGFRIAEEDLKLRGPGELFGTRQSGMPELRIADLVEDRALMDDARTAAFDLVERDPHLRKAEHESVRRKFTSEYSNRVSLGDVG